MGEAWVATYGDADVILAVATTKEGAQRACYEHRHPRGGKDSLRWLEFDLCPGYGEMWEAEGRYGSNYVVQSYPLRTDSAPSSLPRPDAGTQGEPGGSMEGGDDR